MKYAEMIGTVIEAADTAACFLIGITYDSDTNHQLIDHMLVGIQSKVKEAREKGITFFSKLRFADAHLDGFPYVVPMVARAARESISNSYKEANSNNKKAGAKLQYLPGAKLQKLRRGQAPTVSTRQTPRSTWRYKESRVYTEPNSQRVDLARG